MGEKKKIFQWKLLAFDAGRVILWATIPAFRTKKYYMGDKETIRHMGGALIAANHGGFSDPLIVNSLFWYRRLFYTTGENVMTGIRGKFLKAAGCIRIDRTKADLAGIKQCVQVLKSGYLLSMFPQGGIVRDGSEELDSSGVRTGCILIASQAKVPIVPVHIELRQHWWQRHRVMIGEPIVLTDYCEKKFPSMQDMEMLAEVYTEKYNACRARLQEIMKEKMQKQ